MTGTIKLLRVLSAIFFLTAVIELAVIPFTSIGLAGIFAATFGFFFGGILIGLTRLVEDVHALREHLTREGVPA